MEKNKGATFQSYGGQNEEIDEDGNVIEEEGHEDMKKDKAMMKKMIMFNS